ncbi:hypothetical protein T12_16277, partial [Trichinella patagoniensis]
MGISCCKDDVASNASRYNLCNNILIRKSNDESVLRKPLTFELSQRPFHFPAAALLRPSAGKQ